MRPASLFETKSIWLGPTAELSEKQYSWVSTGRNHQNSNWPGLVDSAVAWKQRYSMMMNARQSIFKPSSRLQLTETRWNQALPCWVCVLVGGLKRLIRKWDQARSERKESSSYWNPSYWLLTRSHISLFDPHGGNNVRIPPADQKSCSKLCCIRQTSISLEFYKTSPPKIRIFFFFQYSDVSGKKMSGHSPSTFRRIIWLNPSIRSLLA